MITTFLTSEATGTPRGRFSPGPCSLWRYGNGHEGETEISARGMACRKGLKLRKLQTKLSIRTGGVQ